MKYNSKKKHSFFEKRSIISTILLILFLIVFLFLDNYPSLQPMRDSWIYILISKAMYSSVILYFAWLSNKKPPLFERSMISAFALLPWIPFLIKSDRIILLLKMAIFLVLLFLYAKHFLTNKKYYIVTNTVTLFLALIFIKAVNDYTYLYDSGGIHFWQISLIVAVVIASIFIVLLLENKIQLEDDRTLEMVMASILVMGMSFVLVAYTISNLNYALDLSKPVYYGTIILEKRIDAGSRGPTDYVFTAIVNGEEKEFIVDQSEYFHKKVGDSFKVLLYSGAFGHEYYIYDYNR